MTNRIYGWFSSPMSDTPEHDPPHDASCLFCGEAIFAGDVRTISMTYADSRERSYFYRIHRSCHERASSVERDKIDGIVLEMVARA